MKSIIQTLKKNKTRILLRSLVVLFVIVSAVAIPYATSQSLEDGLHSFSLVGGSQVQAWDCSLIASPTTITSGDSTSLSWTTTNATSGSINNGVGAMTPIASGSKSVSPTVSTTYTATVSGHEGIVTCTAPVTVTAAPILAPTCTLIASPTAITSGSLTTLSWTTTNATSGSIDNGIGAMTPIASSSKSVSPTTNTTYTATVTGLGGTATCTTNVAIQSDGVGGGGGGGGGGSSSPRCDLFRASDTSITSGERVTLKWETRRGSALRIEDDRNKEIFKTKDDDVADKGEVIVRPVRNTRYTLTVDRGSHDDTCTVKVVVADQKISLILDRDQQPLTSISLTQVPYTGFNAGPFLTSVFYTLLALWSMSIAYVLVIKRGAVFGFVLRGRGKDIGAGSAVIPHAEYQSYTQYPKIYEERTVASPIVTMVSSIPVNLPTGMYGGAGYGVAVSTEDEGTVDNEAEMGIDEMAAHLEERAHQHNLLLSSDAIRLIIDHADGDEEQIAFLDEVIARAKEAYPREDGWIVINSERLKALFADKNDAPAVPEKDKEETTDAGMQKGTREKVGASSLAEAIVTGNVAAAYSALDDTPMVALANAAADLDAIFRARRGEEMAISDMLMRASSSLTNAQIESAIAALISAIDGIYQDEGAAVKLAIIKAINATA